MIVGVTLRGEYKGQSEGAQGEIMYGHGKRRQARANAKREGRRGDQAQSSITSTSMGLLGLLAGSTTVLLLGVAYLAAGATVEGISGTSHQTPLLSELTSPFPGGFVMTLAVLEVPLSDIGHQRVVRVGIGEERRDREQDLDDG